MSKPEPGKRIGDATFRYTNSASTDLRKTFARVRREQKAQQEREAQDAQEAARKVAPLLRKP